jgi:hypothetical protein
VVEVGPELKILREFMMLSDVVAMDDGAVCPDVVLEKPV